MKKILSMVLVLAFLLPTTIACTEKPLSDDEQLTSQERTFTGVNFFAANCMSLLYLWNKDIKSRLDGWLRYDLKKDPIQKVQSVRHSYDQWTEVTDAFEAMQSGVEGVSTTYGCDIMLMKMDETTVCAVITVVYKDSPAAQAGLKRGDVVIRINGSSMDLNNYYSLVTDGFLYSKTCSITLLDMTTMLPGTTLSMTAVEMYEDPVVYHSVFDIGGKKVGYLVFTSFTLRSIDTLLGVFEHFKIDHVSELILDLRYNGGGYVTTEEALASMLAPLANVQAGDVFEQQIYNDELTDYYIKKQGADALKTFFKTRFSWQEGLFPSSCDTRSGHLELNHLYAIIDSGSASASESLLVGLMPYMNITLIGQQSHGKFCTGILYGAEEWYDDYKDDLTDSQYGFRKDVKDWGLYLMIGRYADKNGNCPAMPDGLKPAYKVEDRPDLGYAFGDERDPMLRQALILAGRTDLKPASTRATEIPAPERLSRQVVKPAFGKRILSGFEGKEEGMIIPAYRRPGRGFRP